jgi:hypothetical protein
MRFPSIDHRIVAKKYFGSHYIEDGRVLELVCILQRKEKRLLLLGTEFVYDIKQSTREGKKLFLEVWDIKHEVSLQLL